MILIDKFPQSYKVQNYSTALNNRNPTIRGLRPSLIYNYVLLTSLYFMENQGNVNYADLLKIPGHV